jgi:Family of unknown function (DUF6209)
MRRRLHSGKPAEITFTFDFHELVTGDLRPGGSVLLRYDPHRIVPTEEPYRFGDPGRPVTAHLRFREGEAPISVPLHSPTGIVPCPDVDLTGQGSMLWARLDVPADAERLSVWFSYTTASGAIRYDSDYGANYCFGFPCREIDVVRATVTRRPEEPADRFDLTVSTKDAVEDVAVRFFLVADPACAKHEVALQRLGQVAAQEQGMLWAAAVDVPHGAIVRFKVCYWIGGRRLTDDNTGAYYLAPEPDADRVPPPPPALLEAAAAWG